MNQYGNPSPHRHPIEQGHLGDHGHHCPMSVRLQVLADSPIFGALAKETLPEVDGHCTARHFDRGASIYHAGDPADSLYIVAQGGLKLSRPSLDGYDVLVDVVGPGDFLGMLTALGEATFPDTATALTESCVLRFSDQAFRAVINKHPQANIEYLAVLNARMDHALSTVQVLLVFYV